MTTKTNIRYSHVSRAAFCLATFAVFFLSGFLAARPAAAAMPRGAFLLKVCDSADDIAEQLKSHPALLKRYCVAWQLPPEEVLRRVVFLHRGVMPVDATVMVHYWRDNCDRAKNEKVRRGTSVFFDASSRPLVVRACGNPIGLSRPVRRPNTVAAAKHATVSSPETADQEILTKPTHPFAVADSNLLDQPSTGPFSAVGTSSSAIEGFPAPSPLNLVTPTLSVPSAASSGLLYHIDGVLVGSALLIGAFRHDGLGNVYHKPDTIVVPPVPEPSLPVVVMSFLALLASAIALGQRKARRQAAADAIRESV